MIVTKDVEIDLDDMKRNLERIIGKGVTIEIPSEVSRYEFGTLPHKDKKGRMIPGEAPRPCVRHGIIQTVRKIETGNLRMNSDTTISRAFADNMIKESRQWLMKNWPDRKEAMSMQKDFKIREPPIEGPPVKGNIAEEMRRDRMERAVDNFKPKGEKR